MTESELPSFRYYFKEKIDLELDTKQLAVLYKPEISSIERLSVLLHQRSHERQVWKQQLRL